MAYLASFRDLLMSYVHLVARSLMGLFHVPSYRQQGIRFLDHCCQMGFSTFPIVAILSFFIGAVLALQTGFSLQAIGGFQSRIGSIVGLSLCRELGPVMTAFLLAGRIGSATTAELASMTVYQEVDALKTMNIAPERVLVLPRLLAILFMMPLLVMSSIVIGWIGGMVVAKYVAFIDISPNVYWRYLTLYMDTNDVLDGLWKAEIFGFFVILICCHVGLSTRGGPREIGRSVTRAVVTSMIFILFMDYFITKTLI